MPAYTFALHEELAPHLERHPGLFGFYSNDVGYEQSWVKDTGMTTPPYRHANSFLARLHQTPPSPPSSSSSSVVSAKAPNFQHYDNGAAENEHSSGADWFHVPCGPARNQIRRSNAISRRPGREPFLSNRRFEEKRSGTDASPKYDLTRIESLLFNLTSLVQSCAIHLSSPTPSSSTAVPLPQRLSKPLTDLHSYTFMPTSSLVPPFSSPTRWHTFSPTGSRAYMQATTPAQDPLRARLPMPLRSHPPTASSEPMAGRYRAMRTIGRTLGDRKHLLPSLIALLTAQLLIRHMQAVIAMLQEDERVSKSRPIRFPQRSIRSYGVPSKATEVLGISAPVRTPPSASIDAMLPSSNGSFAASVSPRRRDSRTRTSIASACSPPVEINQLLSSKWSPWSPSSSCISSTTNSFPTSQRSKSAKAFAAGPSSASRQGHSELETVSRRLKDLGRDVDKYVRTVGMWIWPASLGGRSWDPENSRHDKSVADSEVDRCRRLLIREGFFTDCAYREEPRLRRSRISIDRSAVKRQG